MTNQTPHTPTPGFQIRPPVITKELQRLVEENKKLIKTALPAMEENERRREEERLKQQNQIPDYTEISWLKVLTQDLGKPQCPEVILLKEWQEYQEGCCYELEDEWEVYYQYDFEWAIKEAEFRWLKLLSTGDWNLLEKELLINWLKDFLGLEGEEDYRGYYNSQTSEFMDEYEACYWSGPSSSNYSWCCNVGYFYCTVKWCTDDNYKILSVRCRLKD